jgi:hypothetical protein
VHGVLANKGEKDIPNKNASMQIIKVLNKHEMFRKPGSETDT